MTSSHRFLAALAALTLFSFGANAQVSSGTVVGTVLDPTGAAIANAKIEAKNVATGVVSSATTTGAGEYRIGDLIAGVYSITASANGFGGTTIQNVTVDANKIATQNLTLAVGQVATNVQVTESIANIDTTTATIQNTFDTQMARDLPVTSIGLGSVNLALLNAGVGSNGGIGAGEGPSVGGQRPRNNNFMIEGVDDNDKSVTGSLIRSMPNDAVAEFTILQNQEGAEYGHSSGGQFNTILKSGTNSFHGSLYEYLENRNLNAIDQIVQNQAAANGVPAVNPRNDSNRFGGSFGGPIIKNKLFFFADYEYNPVGESPTPSAIYAPTAAGYTALSNMSGISATNLGILKQYLPAAAQPDPSLQPYPVVNGVTIPIGDIITTAPAYQNNQALVTTGDYNISDRDQLRARYIYNRLGQIDTEPNLAAFFQFNNGTYHLASLGEYHTFSPSLTNEFRVAYTRENVPVSAGNFKYPGLDQFPNIVLFDLNVDIGPNDSSPQGRTQNTYQILDNMTWVKGRHTIQAGFELRRYVNPNIFTQYSRGAYYYSTSQQFLDDITPDVDAIRGVGTNGQFVYYGNQWSTGEFIQDTFRYSQHLTLTAGLRYQFTSIPTGENFQSANAISGVPGLIAFGVPTAQKKNFAPRLGIAYSPGNKGTTSIRAGFGLAYDVLYDNDALNSLPPQAYTVVNDTGLGASNFLANGGIPGAIAITSAAQARALTSGYIPNQELPYSIQWNAGIQHVFAHDYTVDVRYLGDRGVHLLFQNQLDRFSPVTATNSLPTYLQMPSQATLNALPLTLGQLQSQANCAVSCGLIPAWANAGFGATVTGDMPQGYSSYNGLATQVNRRFANGLQFQGAYTWSHLIDNSTADVDSTALTPRRAQNSQDLTSEKASSALDHRQRFTFTVYYDAPWFRKSNWFARNLLGNWVIAPIYTYESGEWYTVQSNIDANLNNDVASDRAIVNTAGVPGTGSGVTALTNSAGQTVAYLANNPTAQYIVAGKGAYANAGRNTVAGRPIDNVDLSLFKNFSIRENMRLQFGAQFFNLFNHAQFVPGFTNRVDNPAVLNNTVSDVSFLTPGNPIFNNPEAIFSSNPRNIQISAKFSF
ncbi:MAG TPA: TonB-dependent receptor [Bryobacteraceae bacterium]|jgi:hypothetical protein|nr:TonB-dependent receptor [Bryobacteraceae bacterium]